MKLNFMCSHVFQMALVRGTDLEIEPIVQVTLGKRMEVGVCHACAKTYGGDFEKRKYRVIVVRPKKENRRETERVRSGSSR